MKIKIIISTFLSFFYMKNNSFLKSLFSEPNTDRYEIIKDEEIDKDLKWISHHDDSKNLANDYQAIQRDIKKSLTAYITEMNG